MEGVRRFICIGLAGAVLGCSTPTEVPFPNWISDGRLERHVEMSDSFKELARAGAEAERLAGNWLTRVSFTPGQRTILLEKLSQPMAVAARASRGEVRMPDRSSDPFETLPYQRGWRLIGRAMVWKIERSVAMEDFEAATDWTLAATRFGLALTAGSASDAGLGYTTMDEARAAFAPAATVLSPSLLRQLGTGIEAALRNRPPSDAVAGHEKGSMLRAVQFVQDAFRARKLGDLTDELGKDIDPAIEYLEDLRTKAPKERAAYFAGFADEAGRTADFAQAALKRNARQRSDMPRPVLTDERPWRRFAKHFFRSLEPIYAMRDVSLARTKLLGLSSLLVAECRTNGVAPSSLVGISSDLVTDPYSGLPMVYKPEGDRFLLYSVGEDFKDDGGESDAAGRYPDLRAEGQLY